MVQYGYYFFFHLQGSFYLQQRKLYVVELTIAVSIKSNFPGPICIIMGMHFFVPFDNC
jgi:hypothetical protein